MCGIIGFSGWNSSTLHLALDKLAHRGPNDSGLYFDQAARIGLGHRRLSNQWGKPQPYTPWLSVYEVNNYL